MQPGMPAASETAGRATLPQAVTQADAAYAARMASLQARLAAPGWEQNLAGPPPTFKTSVLEDLRRELQTPPLDRAARSDGPDNIADPFLGTPEADAVAALAEPVSAEVTELAGADRASHTGATDTASGTGTRGTAQTHRGRVDMLV